VHVIFLESLCDNDDIITSNIRSVKLSSPDYAGWDADRAVADYWKRIRGQAGVYDTVTADEGPYIKVMNVGERIEINRIEGYLQTRCCFFLMNIHTRPRTIFFARVSCGCRTLAYTSLGSRSSSTRSRPTRTSRRRGGSTPSASRRPSPRAARR
jgi:hypothetical protein